MDRVIKNGTKLFTVGDRTPRESRMLKLNMLNTGAEGAKTEWADQSGLGHDFALTDVSKVGDTMQFNGTGGSIAKRANFLKTAATAQPFTVAARMFWTSNTEWQCIFEVGTTDSAGNYTIGMHFYVQRGANLYINPVSTSSHFWDNVVAVNTEYHIALTYDGANFIAYVDGVALATVPRAGAAFDKDDLIFGSRNGSLQLQGYMKDYYVYDRALTAEEVGKLRDFGGRAGNLLTSRSKQPYALRFDGDDYVKDIPVVNTLGSSALGSITIGMWVKYENTGGLTDVVIVALPDIGDNRLVIHLNYNGRIYFDFGNMSGGRISAPAPTDWFGKWEYWAFTAEAGVGMKLWRNGSVYASSTTTASFTPTSDRVFQFGDSSLRGEVAKPYMFNRALTQAELQHHMNNGSFSDESGLMEEWIPVPRALLGKKGNHGRVEGSNTVIHSTLPLGQRSSLGFGGDTNHIVDFGDKPEFAISGNAITQEAWIYPTAYAAYATIQTKVSEYYFQLGSDGKLQAYQYGTSPAGYHYSDGVVPLFRWTHVAYSYDGANLVFYINGKPSGSVAKTGNVTSGKAYPLTTGSEPTTRPFTGLISMVRLWNVGRTEQEIKQDMHRYLPSSTPGLIDEWRLSEGAGKNALGVNDNTGIIKDAYWKEPTLANWRAGHVKFDGTDDYADCGTGLKLHDRSFTVEFWAKRTANNQNDYIFNLGPVGAASDNNMLVIGFRDTNYFTFAFWRNDLNTSAAYTDLEWHHWACVYDASTKSRTIYRDGAVAGQDTSTSHLKAEGNLLLARYFPSSTSWYYGGLLDELRTWNVPRTQAEIQENMNKVLGRHPNLVLNMHFDHDGFWDASGYGNHGTPVNGPIIEDNNNDKLNYNAPINL